MKDQMRKATRARVLASLDDEILGDIAVLASAEEKELALAPEVLAKFAARDIERCRFLIELGELPAWTLDDALRREREVQGMMRGRRLI